MGPEPLLSESTDTQHTPSKKGCPQINIAGRQWARLNPDLVSLLLHQGRKVAWATGRYAEEDAQAATSSKYKWMID